MKKWVKQGLKKMRETAACPYCDFKINGILRVHNGNGECELMNNVNIKELMSKVETKTPKR